MDLVTHIMRVSFLMANFKVPYVHGVTTGSSNQRECRAAVRYHGSSHEGLEDVRDRPELWATKIDLARHMKLSKALPLLTAIEVTELVLDEHVAGRALHEAGYSGDDEWMTLVMAAAEKAAAEKAAAEAKVFVMFVDEDTPASGLLKYKDWVLTINGDVATDKAQADELHMPAVGDVVFEVLRGKELVTVTMHKPQAEMELGVMLWDLSDPVLMKADGMIADFFGALLEKPEWKLMTSADLKEKHGVAAPRIRPPVPAPHSNHTSMMRAPSRTRGRLTTPIRATSCWPGVWHGVWVCGSAIGAAGVV